MKKFRLVNLAVMFTLVLYFGSCFTASSQTASKKTQSSPGSSRVAVQGKPVAGGAAHVYLFRGLMNIFSLGMDDLAQKIQRAGVESTVHEHGDWQRISDEIAAKYKAGNHGAIVLIGHSLGADAVMLMGQRLSTLGVPVALIVPFDATRSLAATGNVARVMNITQRDYAYMTRGFGFRGELQNVDVSRDESVGHITIDKSGRLHAMVVNKVVSVVGRGGGVDQASASAGDAPPPLPKHSPISAQSAKPPEAGVSVDVGAANATAAAAVSPAAGLPPVISDVKPTLPSMPPAKVETPASATNTSLEFQQLAPRNQN